MERTIQELYSGYVRAMQFLDEILKSKRLHDDERSFLTVKIVSAEEFPGWWESVCHDHDARQRWLERFDDPEAALIRARNRISEDLGQISFPRAA